jgi:hypothetical protein
MTDNKASTKKIQLTENNQRFGHGQFLFEKIGIEASVKQLRIKNYIGIPETGS